MSLPNYRGAEGWGWVGAKQHGPHAWVGCSPASCHRPPRPSPVRGPVPLPHSGLQLQGRAGRASGAGHLFVYLGPGGGMCRSQGND